MSDYAFMRTGAAGTTAEIDEGVLEVAKRMMAVCIAMVEKAGLSAVKYSIHAGRTKIGGEDMIRALQYQSKVFLTTDDETLDASIAAARQDVDDAMCDSDEEDSGEEDPPEEEDFPDEEEWTPSACSCAVCAGMNEAHETWSSWNPDDEALAYLKRATDKYIASKRP